VLHQFTTGLIGIPGLCNFISPFMEGLDGFRFMYFHLLSLGISVLLCFILFLISVCYVLVGSLVVVMKLLPCRKFCILDSYCCVGRITMEFPLSTVGIMALLSFSLDLIDFIVLVLGCVQCEWLGLLFCCSVLKLLFSCRFLFHWWVNLVCYKI
jgi:hypothetical protein